MKNGIEFLANDLITPKLVEIPNGDGGFGNLVELAWKGNDGTGVDFLHIPEDTFRGLACWFINQIQIRDDLSPAMVITEDNCVKWVGVPCPGCDKTFTVECGYSMKERESMQGIHAKRVSDNVTEITLPADFLMSKHPDGQERPTIWAMQSKKQGETYKEQLRQITNFMIENTKRPAAATGYGIVEWVIMLIQQQTHLTKHWQGSQFQEVVDRNFALRKEVVNLRDGIDILNAAAKTAEERIEKKHQRIMEVVGANKQLRDKCAILEAHADQSIEDDTETATKPEGDGARMTKETSFGVAPSDVNSPIKDIQYGKPVAVADIEKNLVSTFNCPHCEKIVETSHTWKKGHQDLETKVTPIDVVIKCGHEAPHDCKYDLSDMSCDEAELKRLRSEQAKLSSIVFTEIDRKEEFEGMTVADTAIAMMRDMVVEIAELKSKRTFQEYSQDEDKQRVKQIDKLWEFLEEKTSGPRNEGAVDCAIRVINELQNEVEVMEGFRDNQAKLLEKQFTEIKGLKSGPSQNLSDLLTLRMQTENLSRFLDQQVTGPRDGNAFADAIRHINDLKAAEKNLDAQVDTLSTFIDDQFGEWQGEEENAVDCAIRIITHLKGLDLERKTEVVQGEPIDILAKFLMSNYPHFGGPLDEGAVDMAIRVMKEKIIDGKDATTIRDLNELIRTETIRFESECKALQSTIERKQIYTTELIVSHNAIEAELKELNHVLNVRQSRVDNAKRERDNLSKRDQQHVIRNNNLERRRDELETELSSVTSQSDAWCDAFHALEAKQVGIDQIMEAGSKRVNQLTTQRDALETELARVREQRDQLQSNEKACKHENLQPSTIPGSRFCTDCDSDIPLKELK